MGLIGSSMAHAMRRAGLAAHIAGYAPSRGNARWRAQSRLCRFAARTIPARLCADADLVMLAHAGRQLRRAGKGHRAASETGRHRDRCGLGQDARWCATSARTCPKACISFRPIPSPAPNNPAPKRASPNLFDGRWCILTPPPGTDPEAVEKLEEFLAALRQPGRCDGCRSHHDLVLAITSHVPHLIAYNIVGTAA